jgi:hypothetical protein
MSYITLDTNRNIDPFISTKPLSSYSEDLLRNMRMLSFFPKGLADPFGSFIYRIQKYPGDVDLIEEFQECCTVNDVINKFIKNLRRVIKDILSSKMHYFSEFKCGLDHRYDIDIGDCTNGVYRPNRDLRLISLDLMKKGLLNMSEYNKIDKILSGYMYDGDGYDVIFNIFRNRRVLRWSAEELLSGKKNINGYVIKLFDALHDHTAVKIDVLLLYNDRFIEMTNYVILEVRDPDHWINVDPNIQKLYSSNFYYSPFKMVKRMFSLARNQRDINILNKIIPLISSNVSSLYQSKSEIDVLLLIIEVANKPPLITIKKQLDLMKGRLVNILQFSDNEINDIIDIIDDCLVEKNLSNIYNLLENLNIIIKKKINFLTIAYLDTVALNPPPAYILPSVRTYSLSKRTPMENPKIFI